MGLLASLVRLCCGPLARIRLTPKLPPAALEAARYVCRRLPGIPKTSYVKLMYLVDREYARRHGRGLTGAPWFREQYGPLSRTITKLIEGPEFSATHSKTSKGNPKIGLAESEAAQLRHLGGAELAVLDLVIARHGSQSQVALLNHIHRLPEVAAAEQEGRIDLPHKPAPKGTSEYVAELLNEIREEHKAGLHGSGPMPPDEIDARRREAESLLRHVSP